MFCHACGNAVAEGQQFCQQCGARLTPETAAAETVRTATPWEARRDIGFFNGLVKTIKETLFSPTGFFKKMPVSGGLADPLLYALIVSMAGLMVFYFWDSLLRAPLQDYVGPQFRTATEQNMLVSKGGPVLAIGTPFFLLGGLFVVAGLQHVLLLVFRGAQAGFEATFRVVCYSISPTVFLMVPVCGMPVASIWSLVLAIIGLKEAHRISGSRAALAVLAPFFACCGMLLMMIVLFLGAFAAAVGNFIQQYR